MSWIRRTVRATLSRTAFAALALAGALSACDDPLGPGIDQQPVPFYYYEDEKIYLQVDGGRLTAVPEVAGDTVTLRAVVARAGVPADSVRPMLNQPGHWFVHLGPSTSARRAEAAARQLRLDPGVRFASAVYRVRDTECPLYMVNRLVVQFRAGTDEAAIASFNNSTGVRNQQVMNWGRLYEYPADMAATPLELAAHYHRQRIVDWADADRSDGCLRIGAQPAP